MITLVKKKVSDFHFGLKIVFVVFQNIKIFIWYSIMFKTVSSCSSSKIVKN